MTPLSDLRRTEFYNGFLRPLGTKTGFGVTLRREGPCNFDFALLGAQVDQAIFDRTRRRLEALVRPLQRAFDCVRARMGNAGRGAMWASYVMQSGIVRIGAGAKVLSVDDRALALLGRIGTVMIDRAGRFVSAEPDVTAAIAAALASSVSRAPYSRVIHLRRGETEPAFRLTVCGIPDDEAAFFRGPECILLLENTGDMLGPAVATFGDMYGLTKTERSMLLDLIHGLMPCQIATARGIALETVRGHFKSIYLRTGINRQVDLVRHVCLLTGCAPAPAGVPFAPQPPPPDSRGLAAPRRHRRH